MSNNQNQGASIEAERVIDAVRKLVKAKGRFHTEQNYKALSDALAAHDAARRSVPPAAGGDLPPLPADMLTRFWDIAGAEWMATGKSQSLLYAEKIAAYAIATDRALRKQAGQVDEMREALGMCIAALAHAGVGKTVREFAWANAIRVLDGVDQEGGQPMNAGAQPDQRESAADTMREALGMCIKALEHAGIGKATREFALENARRVLDAAPGNTKKPGQS